MDRAAIFDVDDTIIEGQSQQILARYLFKKGKISKIIFFKIFFYFLFYKMGLLKDLSLMRKRIYKAIITNWKVDELKCLCRECFDTYIKSRIYTKAIELIQEHKKKGHIIILLSAAISEIVENIANYVDADYFYATELEKKDEVYTGQIKDDPVYGDYKFNLIQFLANKHDFNLSESTFYSDSYSDSAIYYLIKNFITVNPDAKMKSFANANNLKSIYFKEKICTILKK